MPTYQYACTDCAHAFEEFQSFSDDALTLCPACGGKLRKVYNAVGVVFKGSGFYRTDSREKSANGAKSESSGSEKSEKSDKSDSTKTESSKPEKSLDVFRLVVLQHEAPPAPA